VGSSQRNTSNAKEKEKEKEKGKGNIVNSDYGGVGKSKVLTTKRVSEQNYISGSPESKSALRGSIKKSAQPKNLYS